MNLARLSTLLAIVGILWPELCPAQSTRDWHQSALKSKVPDDEILHEDVDGDGKPDIVERWWNGKRVRWLDENGDLRLDDTRGDQVADVLQVDGNNDGQYDGLGDFDVKWADVNRDGIPDLQAWVLNPAHWSEKDQPWGKGTWMIFQNFDQKGTLGWMDWENFKFDCWSYTGKCDWLPNYHGNSVFLKIHVPVFTLDNPGMNWENPFAFYDFDDDGVPEMAMRWLDNPTLKPGKSTLSGRLTEAYVAFDLDNDSGKGNETDYDMTLRGDGGPGIDYREMKVPVPGFRGNPKFDVCFWHNNWRRLDNLCYLPYDRGYETFFTNSWERMYFVFDEDDDDHRWERVELYYPTVTQDPKSAPVDIYSTRRTRGPHGELPGFCAANSQSDSLGDRGEFDADNSGKGRLYIGVFDRKLHLAGAEWGAWTVDQHGKFHGGTLAPSPRPAATNVEEVVKYTDTDHNGFLDTIEYDYDGDRHVDFKVCLLDYQEPGKPPPDVAPLLDPRQLGWKGLHQAFNQMADQAWVEALAVYRAAWRRGLTTPELDKLAFAASKAERYDHAYWLKEKIFRLIRARLDETGRTHPGQAAAMQKLGHNLTRLYYLGRFDEYTKRIAEVPAR